jgi:hypothetical protein
MTLRPTVNLVLAAALLAGGVLLLLQESFFLRARWDPTVGTLFSGWSLRFLAGTLFGLAGFAGAVAVAWIRGAIPPPAEAVLVHPVYKGQILVRHWHLMVVTFGCLALAFTLAERGVPNPALAPENPREAAEEAQR